MLHCASIPMLSYSSGTCSPQGGLSERPMSTWRPLFLRLFLTNGNASDTTARRNISNPYSRSEIRRCTMYLEILTLGSGIFNFRFAFKHLNFDQSGHGNEARKGCQKLLFSVFRTIESRLLHTQSLVCRSGCAWTC